MALLSEGLFSDNTTFANSRNRELWVFWPSPYREECVAPFRLDLGLIHIPGFSVLGAISLIRTRQHPEQLFQTAHRQVADASGDCLSKKECQEGTYVIRVGAE